MKKKKDPGEKPTAEQVELLATRSERFAEYKQTGARIREIQAEIAEIDANLIRSGFAQTVDPVLW